MYGPEDSDTSDTDNGHDGSECSFPPTGGAQDGWDPSGD